MLNDPLIRYELTQAQQRERWQQAERSRQARAALSAQAVRVERMEAAPDLTGLVERVLQHVWKRLGLPARKPGARTAGEQRRLSSGALRPAHPQDLLL